LARRDAPLGGALALPQGSSCRSRHGRLHGAALPFRGDGDLGALPGRPGRVDRRGAAAALDLADAPVRLDPVPSLGSASAAGGRAPARQFRRHPAHARHPPFDYRGGDELELVERLHDLGSAPRHAAARPPGRGHQIGVAAYRDPADVTLPRLVEMPFTDARPDWLLPSGERPRRPSLPQPGRLARA